MRALLSLGTRCISKCRPSIGLGLAPDRELGAWQTSRAGRPQPVMTSSAQVYRHRENQPAGGGRWALIDPSAAAQVTEDRVQPRHLQLVAVNRVTDRRFTRAVRRSSVDSSIGHRLVEPSLEPSVLTRHFNATGPRSAVRMLSTSKIEVAILGSSRPNRSGPARRSVDLFALGVSDGREGSSPRWAERVILVKFSSRAPSY